MKGQWEWSKNAFKVTAVPPQQIRRWLLVILTISLLFIFYSTLFPFDFFANLQITFSERLRGISFNLDGIRDFPENVLLFVSLGFSLVGLSRVQGWGRRTALTLTIAVGFGLSLLIEITQTYSTVRFATVTDVVANALGAFLGAQLFAVRGERLVWWGISQVDRVRPYLTKRHLTIAISFYLGLMLILALFLQQLTSLTNWDTSYPLLLGNELTGNRAWRGTLSQVYMADRVLSEAEIARLFAGDEPTTVARDSLLIYQNFTEGDPGDNFPTMTWHGEPTNANDTDGVALSRANWLRSSEPVTELSQTLAANSQFTLGAIVTPARLDRRGPARIISISKDVTHRNLTLGQRETDLVLRLRTPFTGENGINPQLIIPNFFADTRQHHVVITYDGMAVRFYADGPENIYHFELSPAFALFSYYPSVEIRQMRLHTENTFIFSLLYDAVVFLPVSAMLALLVRRSTGSMTRQMVTAVTTIIFAAVIWEWMLSLLTGGYALWPDGVLLAVSVAVAACFIFMIWMNAWLVERL